MRHRSQKSDRQHQHKPHYFKKKLPIDFSYAFGAAGLWVSRGRCTGIIDRNSYARACFTQLSFNKSILKYQSSVSPLAPTPKQTARTPWAASSTSYSNR